MRITFSNPSQHRFQGWVLVTVPRSVIPEQTQALRSGPCSHAIPGKPVGRKGQRLHCLIDLAPFQVVTLEEWTGAEPPPLPPIPGNFRELLEPLSIAGHFMGLVETEVDGPLVRTLWRTRSVNALAHYELWINYYLGVAWAEGELLCIASNIETPTLPQDMLGGGLVIGSAIVRTRATRNNDVPADIAGRDQGLAGQPVAVYLPGQGFGGTWESAMAFDDGPPSGTCLDWTAEFGPVGVDPPQEDALGFSARHLDGATRRLLTWDSGPLAVLADSGSTGAQEDQGYSFTEPFQPGGQDAARVRYLVACGMSRRPCHFREKDGRPLDLDAHPDLVLWGGVPIFWSRDQLGRGQIPIPTHGWHGPDREHWLLQTLCGAALLTDSPMLQRLIEDQVRVFLFGETVRPGWATSNAGAPRGVGWTLLAAAWMYEALTDRDLAERLRARVRERLDLVLWPQLAESTQGNIVKLWKVTTQNGGEITGTNGLHWSPWEHSIAALGMACAYATFGSERLLHLAHIACETTLLYGWSYDGQRLLEWDKVAALPGNVPLDPSLYKQGDGWAHRSGFFSEWTGAAAAVALRLEHPNPEVRRRASEIVAQVWGDRKSKWRIPG